MSSSLSRDLLQKPPVRLAWRRDAEKTIGKIKATFGFTGTPRFTPVAGPKP